MNTIIDPVNITNFNLSNDELELNLFFWILVSGKKAKTTARMLDELMNVLIKLNNGVDSPFNLIKNINNNHDDNEWLVVIMKKIGFGCYTTKSKGLIEASCSGLNLRECSADDLEKISGIGLKTSRCFLIHTRKNARVAGIDTHLLKHLRDLGYIVPKSTPSSKKEYKRIEDIFLKLADQSNMSLSEYDLTIWRKYSRNN